MMNLFNGKETLQVKLFRTYNPFHKMGFTQFDFITNNNDCLTITMSFSPF